MADVKGDLSGLPFPGGENPKVTERVRQARLKDFSFEDYPVAFWDVSENRAIRPYHHPRRWGRCF